ncbi:MAG: FAD-dependent oxidoreductase [Lachnospiraceae bacterium]|nr:FAD-dependent oxidoreductase [Lachnospiraceae bacterium]
MYDVIVCGGGIAGVSAALAASENNSKVLLIEREYALGGLATLGLICVYLPLCDGNGVQMSSGIAERLLKLSLKYGPGEIPKAWEKNNNILNERIKERYAVRYNPASLTIAMEEELLNKNVKILYGSHISGVNTIDSNISSVVIETKIGKKEIYGKTFVDATGDADICYFAGEKTITDNKNRRTGWYFSYDNKNLQLNGLTDPIYSDIPADSRLYSGIDMEDITMSCIAGRKMILNDVLEKKKNNNEIYPLIIPSFHGLRMTRRLDGEYKFSEKDKGIFFKDSIGMIGNWKKANERYSLSAKILQGSKNKNLYVAGRCVSADDSGQDLTRVIPSCAVTGEAAGTIAAYHSLHNKKPTIEKLQEILIKNGVFIDKTIFEKMSIS